ncbi:MAG: DUF1292 domain-containing protein [Ruminococcus sp.]|nr:DUF1292 domain-containing protein [Ruminococcus sp.]
MAENKDIMLEEDMNEGAIITLTDDEGKEVEFELLDVIEYKGDEYIVLIENDENADEVVIFQIRSLDEETEEYVSIEDEELLNTIFEIFKKNYEGEINFE